jgi:hypothetical protein
MPDVEHGLLSFKNEFTGGKIEGSLKKIRRQPERYGIDQAWVCVEQLCVMPVAWPIPWRVPQPERCAARAWLP